MHSENFKNYLYVHTETKVWFDQNFNTLLYDANLKKINHVRDVKIEEIG